MIPQTKTAAFDKESSSSLSGQAEKMTALSCRPKFGMAKLVPKEQDPNFRPPFLLLAAITCVAHLPLVCCCCLDPKMVAEGRNPRRRRRRPASHTDSAFSCHFANQLIWQERKEAFCLSAFFCHCEKRDLCDAPPFLLPNQLYLGLRVTDRQLRWVRVA